MDICSYFNKSPEVDSITLRYFLYFMMFTISLRNSFISYLIGTTLNHAKLMRVYLNWQLTGFHFFLVISIDCQFCSAHLDLVSLELEYCQGQLNISPVDFKFKYFYSFWGKGYWGKVERAVVYCSPKCGSRGCSVAQNKGDDLFSVVVRLYLELSVQFSKSHMGVFWTNWHVQQRMISMPDEIWNA